MFGKNSEKIKLKIVQNKKIRNESRDSAKVFDDEEVFVILLEREQQRRKQEGRKKEQQHGGGEKATGF